MEGRSDLTAPAKEKDPRVEASRAAKEEASREETELQETPETPEST